MATKKIQLNGNDAIIITLPDTASERDWQLATDAYVTQGTRAVVDGEDADNPACPSGTAGKDGTPSGEESASAAAESKEELPAEGEDKK